jgi:antitoxin ParD1/3/4
MSDNAPPALIAKGNNKRYKIRGEMDQIEEYRKHLVEAKRSTQRNRTMNVSLTPQLEALIQKKVVSGFYNSASEVIREALRLLEENERIKELRLGELRQEVRAGIEQLDQGEVSPFDESTVKRIKVAGLKKLRSTHAKKPA